jgi:hypothetical protein
MYSTRYFCQVLIKAEFFDRFLKNIRMSDFMKIRPAEAALFHTKERIDMMMLNAPEDEMESMRKEEVVA